MLTNRNYSVILATLQITG